MTTGSEKDIFEIFPAEPPVQGPYGDDTPKPGTLVPVAGEVQLWDQLEGESGVAYNAFLTYLNLGLTRSIVETYRIVRNKPDAVQADGSFKEWASKWKWQLRVSAYDSWYRNRNLQQQEDMILNSLSVRTQQAASTRDRMFNMVDRLIDKAERMLEFPLEEISRATLNEGKTTIVTIKPLKWGVGDIATILTMAERLRRIGMTNDEAPQLLGAEQIVEQLAESEGLTEAQKAQALAQLQRMSAEPKTGRSGGN